MKKFIPTLQAFMLVGALAYLTGCQKDSGFRKYTIYTPVFETLPKVRENMKSLPARPLEGQGKIALYGQYIFVNAPKKGFHIIDNSNPANPRNMGFVPVPGSYDIAVRDNYLFTDCYSDLVVFDISNPLNIIPKKFMNNVIPERGYYYGRFSNIDSVKVISDYIAHDTLVDVQTYESWKSASTPVFFDMGGSRFLTQAATSQSSVGGSMASFTMIDNYLYTVSTFKLYSFNIQNPLQTTLASSKIIGGGIETIYPFKNKLFIGSTNGMFIYSLSDPAQPAKEGQFMHARSCDPVITDGSYAYVTLRSGTACQGFTNQLEVVDVTDLQQPKLFKTFPLTNPHGLGKDGNLMFICDGKAGLKIFDASVLPFALTAVKQINMEAYDVICWNKRAIVISEDGLYQFDYSNPAEIKQLSVIRTKGF